MGSSPTWGIFFISSILFFYQMIEEDMRLINNHQYVNGTYRNYQKHSVDVWHKRTHKKDWKCKEWIDYNVVMGTMCRCLYSLHMVHRTPNDLWCVYIVSLWGLCRCTHHLKIPDLVITVRLSKTIMGYIWFDCYIYF